MEKMAWFRSRKERAEECERTFSSRTGSAEINWRTGPDYHLPSQNDITWGELAETKELLASTPLVYSIADQVDISDGCVNINEQLTIGTAINIPEIFQAYSSTLERLYHCAKASGLKSCLNEECCNNFRLLRENFSTQATWCRSFLEWILQWAACFITSLSNPQVKSRPAEACLSIILLQCLKNPIYWGAPAQVDQIPDRVIYDLVEWLATIETHYGSDLSHQSAVRGARAGFRPMNITYDEDYLNAMKRAEALGICKNRLWNVLYRSPREWLDLPSLLALIQGKDDATARLLGHKEDFSLRDKSNMSATWATSDEVDHRACAADLCHFASLDSTRITQRHKCAEASRDTCASAQFPEITENTPDIVIWSYDKTTQSQGGHPADVCSPQIVNADYAAISHVWSDGTGAGAGGGRMVNSCLFRFFCDIAEQVGCKGIWWDTVCIPSDPNLRKKTLRNMHMNYRNSKHTIVHDEYLLQFPWADDGSPCLALLLSPWFTRGWTAVELAMSKSVKVLFKNPNGNTLPLIKDLERDVLNHAPTASLGHMNTSNIIRRLWYAAGNRSLSNLVYFLNTRSTSWPRDRVVIAAHLAGVIPNVDATDMQAQITRQIIMSYQHISASFLLHGHPTISDTGSLSWCPNSLFHGSSTSVFYNAKEWNQQYLTVNQETDTLEGFFNVVPFASVTENHEPLAHVMEYGMLPIHPAARRRIASSVAEDDCYLVATLSKEQSHCIIIRPVKLMTTPRRVIVCEWVGVVLGPVSHIQWSQNIAIGFGGESGIDKPGFSAERFLGHYFSGEEMPQGIGAEQTYGNYAPSRRGYVWNMEKQRFEKQS